MIFIKCFKSMNPGHHIHYI